MRERGRGREGERAGRERETEQGRLVSFASPTPDMPASLSESSFWRSIYHKLAYIVNKTTKLLGQGSH